MGVSNGDEDGGGVDGDVSGAIPHLGRVPEQRLLSPKIGLRWWQHCGTFCRSILVYLGFSCRRHFIGGRAMSEGTRGAHTMRWRGQRWACATLWCGRLPALLRLPFGLRVRVSKIETSAFVSSNSENISFSKNLE
jgi:hypothetical protein